MARACSRVVRLGPPGRAGPPPPPALGPLADSLTRPGASTYAPETPPWSRDSPSPPRTTRHWVAKRRRSGPGRGRHAVDDHRPRERWVGTLRPSLLSVESDARHEIIRNHHLYPFSTVGIFECIPEPTRLDVNQTIVSTWSTLDQGYELSGNSSDSAKMVKAEIGDHEPIKNFSVKQHRPQG